MFELDVGNDLSPQKILVTVEAEEAMRRGINRRLFPSASPTRSDRFIPEATTTTTVPLNDEIENESTPRRRGRPRRTSNGTPMPKGKKRAGTPLKSDRPTRRKSDIENEASIADENDMLSQANAESDTPKAKPKARKTPKPKSVSTTQAVPSSQLSTNATKRKRGRPRKAILPDEIPILPDTSQLEGGDVANKSSQEYSKNYQQPPPGQSSDVPGYEESRYDRTGDDTLNIIDEIARGSDGTPTPADVSYTRGTANTRQEESRTLSHQQGLDDDDMDLHDDYPDLMEQHSDVESDFDGFGGVPHSGQDTLAHASDFSMIAVESLPSFQANRSAFPSSPPQAGSETNMIINQTLESLRRSTQMDANEDDLPAEDDRSGAAGHSFRTNDHSLLGRPRSPKRQKEVPLSRQVFSGKKPHVDASFSSIPDSILRAATPGRLPMKSTSAEDQHEDSNQYEDSFSEIPEEVLEAATPRPAARTAARAAEESHAETLAQPGSVNRNTGSSFGSSRLPTPEDTSSSNAGSKRAPEDDVPEEDVDPSRDHTVAGPSSNTGIRSSPPIMHRPRAMDFGPSQLDHDISNTPLQQSSPQLPPSTKEPTEPSKSLEPPPNSRPSLSPIVRVGRTLQNVMSDRSSPEVREGSLGSPFRGPMNNAHPQPVTSDRSRQSSIVDSPTRASHGITGQTMSRSWLNSRPALRQSTRSNISYSQAPAKGGVIGEVADPFGPDVPDYSETEALRRPAYNAEDRAARPGNSGVAPSATSSVRAVQSSDNAMSWAADGDDQEKMDQQQDLDTMRSRTSTVFATHGSNASQALVRGGEVEEHEFEEEQEHFEEDDGEMPDGGDDDVDLWDIEASRVSPKRPERARTTTQADRPSSRRPKVPSPWRRTSRRLIYREEIASSSQIEIEDALQSEPDEVESQPLARPPRRRPSNVQPKVQEKQPEPEVDNERSSHQPERETSMTRPEFRDRSDSPEPVEADEYSMMDEQPQEESPAAQEKPAEFSEYSMLVDQNGATPANKNQEKPADVSEYSMLAQRTADAPTNPEQPPSVKSRLFRGFNIMSFFSSPASLPKNTAEAGQADATRKADKIIQPLFHKPVPREPEMSRAREPQQSLWSTGLFPSIPQKEAQPSPEQQSEVYTPGPALRSNDTVPDTYDREPSSSELSPVQTPSPEPSPEPKEQSPAPSLSPEPDSPETESPEPELPEPNSPELESPETTQSHQPSTPERQIYPPIEQKRDFTPRPGQSGGSLFRRGPSAPRSEAEETDLLQLPSDEPEQQESSLMTDGTDYERLPPRDVPSRWDRTLSPSKSCFRSPLKPTTPGRVVAFAGSGLSPTAQAQAQGRARVGNHNAGIRGGSVVSQGPFLQPIVESRETESAASTSYARGPTRPLRNIAPATATFKTNTSALGARFSNTSAPILAPAAAHTTANKNTTANINTRPPPPRPLPALAPAPAPAPAAAPAQTPALSQTNWTRQHWARLDALLQLRRRDPPAFQQRHALPPRSRRRTIHAGLLGKEVAAQGARLVLEPWHLEVVDAFRHEVGAWDERALAKRLFALVVGEERRMGRLRGRGQREGGNGNRGRGRVGGA